MNQKDIKLLWGRAANRCAICRCELSQDAQGGTLTYPLGEQAHIVASEPNGPRGQSLLTTEERDTYHNMILLCPNHHTEIDKIVLDWPVDRLHFKKSEHELWVRETLADSSDQVFLAKQVAVTYIVDSAVELCQLENWKGWTEGALSPDPHWPRSMPRQAFEFRQRAIAAIWPPEFDDLKRATLAFSKYLSSAARNFQEHARLEGDYIVNIRFYSGSRFNPNYDRDLSLYNAWIDKGSHLLLRATAAANWFADVVRRDLNPMFFARTGKFLVIEGPLQDFSIHASLYELREEERAKLPEGMDEVA
jgi:hypothetical protein